MAFSTAVQLEDVWKRFGAVEAVRGVSLMRTCGVYLRAVGAQRRG